MRPVPKFIRLFVHHTGNLWRHTVSWRQDGWTDKPLFRFPTMVRCVNECYSCILHYRYLYLWSVQVVQMICTMMLQCLSAVTVRLWNHAVRRLATDVPKCAGLSFGMSSVALGCVWVFCILKLGYHKWWFMTTVCLRFNEQPVCSVFLFTET